MKLMRIQNYAIIKPQILPVVLNDKLGNSQPYRTDSSLLALLSKVNVGTGNDEGLLLSQNFAVSTGNLALLCVCNGLGATNFWVI